MAELFQALPDQVTIYEVSPRDGLQNEAVTVPTNGKLRLIEALIDSGLKHIEVSSFVSPKWVPQLADAEQVVRRIPAREGLVCAALCPNRRGLERALDCGIAEIGVFVSSSETHNRKNVNKSIDETLAVFADFVPDAVRTGLRVRGYVSTMWGCPYEGVIAPARGLRVANRLLELGCYQVSLGDTIGVGNPRQTQDLLHAFFAEIEPSKLALHLHDTRGTALSNVIVGLEMGIRTFDASVGGLGGCPYAPGAAGNLATEDLVYTLQGMGVQTGVDLEKLWEAGQVAEAIVGRELPGKVHKAGVRALRR